MASSPKAPVLAADGTRSRDLSLDGAIFGADVKPHLVHEAVRSEANAHRSATKALKTRGMVAGGRGKPWRQKGTGRARAGTIRAPQFTGGGSAFAPRSSYEVKVNRKAYRSALRSALTDHARNGTFAIVPDDLFPEPSTRSAWDFLGRWGKELPLLVVAEPAQNGLVKSFRNIDGVVCVPPSEVEVGALVWARSLLVAEGALDVLQRRAA